ncbi:MAG: 3-isopropylmalate dehydrogenase [Calditrichaeota bacterium]|nr:3-isopropylmalate dehydrogenase [Calditrichota bacterium]
MIKKVILLPGDGIGVEVTQAAVKVLNCVCEMFGLPLELQECLVGGASIDAHGIPIEDEVLAACQEADAVFLGAVGGPKWDRLPQDRRPEIALLRLRKELGLFTNLRPVKVFEALLNSSTLKPEVIENIDILIVRELTGGIYFGQPKFTEVLNGEERAVDTMEYRTSEIERIARVAFDAARSRRKRMHSVDKANVLVTSQLWRKTVDRISTDYPDVTLEHMLVDNCAMQLVRNPNQFDVLLTENMFGDILSDEAAMITGSLGMLPSASLGSEVGLYEPVHGSAPDISGKNLANPLAAIGSIAMMFRYSFEMEDAAQRIEQAIQNLLNAGITSFDLGTGNRILGTIEMGEEIINEMQAFFLPYI